jgi:hypothetical protein
MIIQLYSYLLTRNFNRPEANYTVHTRKDRKQNNKSDENKIQNKEICIIIITTISLIRIKIINKK